MDDFNAYPSRVKLTLYLLGSFAFFVGGLWMIGAFGAHTSNARYSKEFTILIGALVVVFSATTGFLAFKRMFDMRAEISVDSTGILTRLWSEKKIPWSEIVDVSIYNTRGQKFIVLKLRDRSRFPGQGIPALFAGLNRDITGGDVTISLNGTNRRFEDARSSIDRFRALAA